MPPAAELAELAGAIKSRFGSVHAFAKKRPGGLARSTIYQVLKGVYGGDSEKQLSRIRAALGQGEGAAGVFEVLRRVACGRCDKKRRRSRYCQRCQALWKEQAAALRGLELVRK